MIIQRRLLAPLLTAVFMLSACATDDSEMEAHPCDLAQDCVHDAVSGDSACRAGYTWESPADPNDYDCVPVIGGQECVPVSCELAQAACGLLSDGCGETLDCGACPAGRVCDEVGGVGVCAGAACEPTSCEIEGKDCGEIVDGCGATLNCGTCAEGQACGDDAEPNVCRDGADEPVFHLSSEGLFGESSGVTLTMDERGFHRVDMDSDGDVDLLVTGERRLSWHENTGLVIDGWPAHDILEGFLTEDCSSPADCADGVCDALSGWGGQAKCKPQGLGVDDCRKAVAADYDDDGDPDVAWACYGGLATDDGVNFGYLGFLNVFENTGDEQFTSYASFDIPSASDVAVLAQATGSSFLVTSVTDDYVIRIKHQPGSDGAFQTSEVLTMNGAHSVHAADFDGDGLQDFVAGGIKAHKLVWCRNKGAAGFAEDEVIDYSDDYNQLAVGDLNNDGFIDVVAANDDGTVIALNQGDGAPLFMVVTDFGPQANDQLSLGSEHMTAADMDGDGDLDLLQDAHWFENSGQDIPQFKAHRLFGPSSGRCSAIVPLDADNDGDLDVVCGYRHKVSGGSYEYSTRWFQNGE